MDITTNRLCNNRKCFSENNFDRIKSNNSLFWINFFDEKQSFFYKNLIVNNKRKYALSSQYEYY
jgi:hypothetical protein